MSFARHYTASNDCTPARAAMLTGLYTHQTGCMITGGSTLDPGFPDVGDDAARARLPHPLARQVAPHPPRQPLDAVQRRTGARALRLRRRHVPLARRRPRPGLARRPAHRAPSSTSWFAAEGGAEPWCTTVSFVNPHDIAWWYAWSERVPAEASARRAVHRLPPNFETPEQLIERAQAAAAALAAGHRRRVLRAGAVQRPRSRAEVAGVPRPLREAPARGRPPHRPCAAHAGKPPGGRRQHGDRVHLRPRRVRRLARPARQGRGRLRGGASACR